MRIQDLRIHLEEAGAAKDRTALRGVKRHGCALAATGTGYRDFDSLFYPRGLSGGNRGETFILSLLALFAPFRRILETLVPEELLFTGCPDEVTAAIDAMDGSVLDVGLGNRRNDRLRTGSIETVLRHTGKNHCSLVPEGGNSMRPLFDRGDERYAAAVQ